MKLEEAPKKADTERWLNRQEKEDASVYKSSSVNQTRCATLRETPVPEQLQSGCELRVPTQKKG